MIEIKTVIILAKELESIKDDLKELYSFRSINLENENIEAEIADNDITIVVIDKNSKNFTKELYDKIDKDKLLVYFNPIKVNINKISPSEFKSIREVQSFKKSIDDAKGFDIEQLKKDLDTKTKEVKAKKEAELRPQIDSTYLEAIKIKDYFSIADMEIEDLKGKKEIYFVGENGDGKTVLLQAIALALKGDDYLKLDYIDDERKEKIELTTKDRKFQSEYRKYKNVKNLFAYGINRNKIHYESFDVKGYSGLFDTSDYRSTTFLKDPQKVLESTHPLIMKFIEKLNSDILINNLKVETNPLSFKEENYSIDFDKLSEGYKSTIIWLCDLVSRLIKNQPDVKDLKELKGIVLIDEVDLYLHPKWKYSLIHSIREVFESIQFIMTTHSLVTILGASEDAVFYKVYKEDGETKITGQIDDISYYTSNILLTSPIFNLDSMKARGFKKDERLSSDDYIYREIHTAIREHMKNNPSTMDDELKEKVRAELKERLAKLRKK